MCMYTGGLFCVLLHGVTDDDAERSGACPLHLHIQARPEGGAMEVCPLHATARRVRLSCDSVIILLTFRGRLSISQFHPLDSWHVCLFKKIHLPVLVCICLFYNIYPVHTVCLCSDSDVCFVESVSL